MSVRKRTCIYHIKHHQQLLFMVLNFVVIFFLLVLFSGCVSLTCANVDETVLTDGWYQNLARRDSGSQLLGLEKWCSVTYELPGNYPGSLTVITMKTLVLLSDEELLKKNDETIEKTAQGRINLSVPSKMSGERINQKKHKTYYTVYDGVDERSEPWEKVKIIGETWNCGPSGTAVICIGVAYITNTTDGSSQLNFATWNKIMMDPLGTIDDVKGDKGIIFNVICH